MRIGHGVERLEIVMGEPMGGYADRTQGVNDILDPLEVHAVTFADDAHRFALIVADLVCVNVDVVDQIRAALCDLGVDSCWVAATHTHASPDSGCMPGGGLTPPRLGHRLVTAAAEATRVALTSGREATLHATRARVPGLGGRRDVADHHPIAVPLDALVVSGAGRVIGMLVVCPVHPTVLPADNNDISADLNGGIRRALDAPDRWVVVVTGAAGNISTRHTRRARSRAEVDRLGELVAERLLPDERGPVRPDHSWVRPPVSKVVRLRAKQVSEVEAALAVAPDYGNTDERTRWVYEQGRRVARDLAAKARVEPHEIDVQAVGLAGVTLVAVPGELFLELGESIRRDSSAHGSEVVVLGYANGYLGYLPSHGTPPTYETFVSPVSSGSGEQVVETAVRAAEAVEGMGSEHDRV